MDRQPRNRVRIGALTATAARAGLVLLKNIFGEQSAGAKAPSLPFMNASAQRPGRRRHLQRRRDRRQAMVVAQTRYPFIRKER